MSQTVIRVENLSKRYLLGHKTGGESRERYVALRNVIARNTRNMGRKTLDMLRGRQILSGDEVEEFWALKDVSFEVKRRRGHRHHRPQRRRQEHAAQNPSAASPSRPRGVSSSGAASRACSKSAPAFIPELTGRENIFLNGAILGMTRREIRRKFDEIVAFAEVEKFLDTPVKRYSSGMYVRLAFAVAAHLEPEILIVDEVLAVGDAEFQKKCLGKMDDVSRREGRTVLFVSHNMGIAAKLCGPADMVGPRFDPGLWACGRINDKIFVAFAQKRRSGGQSSELPRPYEDTGIKLRIEELEWISPWPLRQGDRTKARITFSTKTPVSDVAIGILFRNVEGNQLMECCSDLSDGARKNLPGAGRYSAMIEINSLPLAPDAYTLDIGCRSGDTHGLDYIPACVEVDVIPGSHTLPHTIGRCAGVQLPTTWSWEELGEFV